MYDFCVFRLMKGIQTLLLCFGKRFAGTRGREELMPEVAVVAVPGLLVCYTQEAAH